LQAGLDTSVIPAGLYCYESHGITERNGLPVLETTPCRYWRTVPGRREQERGYCGLLEVGDWQLPIGLLWDQCKECGINDDWESE
jgi:hypothetical protein